MTRTVPSLKGLAEFATAADRNARRLLDDAALLLRNHRWPTAYAVSVLAFEEAGKAWNCVLAMMVPGDVRPEWPFAELMATHVDKLMAAHGLAHLFAAAAQGEDPLNSLTAVVDDLETLAREHNQAKQRGLYADQMDGGVWEPRSIGKDEAAKMVRVVSRLLDHGSYLADPGFLSFLIEPPADVQESLALWWDHFAAGIREESGKGVVAAMRSLYDESGATQGLAQMVRELEQDAERKRAAARQRNQPRRPPPRARRR